MSFGERSAEDYWLWWHLVGWIIYGRGCSGAAGPPLVLVRWSARIGTRMANEGVSGQLAAEILFLLVT